MRESEFKRGITNLSANSAPPKKEKSYQGTQIHRKKSSLHEHKINILTEFTNTTNHKTYLFEQTVL